VEQDEKFSKTFPTLHVQYLSVMMIEIGKWGGWHGGGGKGDGQ